MTKISIAPVLCLTLGNCLAPAPAQGETTDPLKRKLASRFDDAPDIEIVETPIPGVDRIASGTVGDVVAEESCADTPVREHFDLGVDIAVRGTPAMYAADGPLLGGHLAPDDLLAALDERSR